MDQRDREQVDRCCESIVPKINMTKLLPKLLDNKVFNRDDVNLPRWMKNLELRDTVKDIYLTIKTRGPNAFKNFILSLRQSDHENEANILEGISNTNTNIKQEDPLCHHIWSDEPLTIKVHKATRFLDCEYDVIERYPMRSRPRGLVLIITNIYYELSYEKHRFSAKHDKDNLKKLFEEMGFTVITYRNLKGQEMKDKIQEFSKREDLRKVDSCFVIITSHGTEDEENNTEIQGTDYHSARQTNYEKLLCTEVCDYFTTEACPQLAEKPKIFIFQLCRGKKKQKGVAHGRITTDTCVSVKPTTNTNLEIQHIQTIRNYSDMLVVQSTLPGHVSYRDSVTGSWFIQILCKIFMNHAHTNHVQDLFSMIDAELKHLRTTNNECQTSSIQSLGFNKHCYLNPGLFMES
ncbi:caspase Dronc isoform X2 [Pogonomyrmex barbatus]|uniref:Caspase Dronc isoform X2 n=1 Tax=Pogonomyrmex barbatus TaxID=144034 RepID=A0A6I9WBG8_9HYME|nr:caspase Dronc isoform X2 [Pogonomyrmex barbatus]